MSEFDFIEIPSALPDITLWEVFPDGRIICRMVGTGVIARMKSDMTGTDLTKVIPETPGYDVHDDVKHILSRPCGLFQMVQNKHVTGKIARLESLTLPLNPDPGGVPKLVTVNHMIETVKHGTADALTDLTLMRTLEENTFVDIGWGIPPVEN